MRQHSLHNPDLMKTVMVGKTKARTQRKKSEALNMVKLCLVEGFSGRVEWRMS